MKRLVLFASLMLPAPALAQADNSALAVVAGAARYRLSASADLLMQDLDERSQRVLAAALGLDEDPALGLLWPDVVAGALQVRREANSSADTLWFNPLLDVGLVVRWVPRDNGWEALAAAPFLGERLRGEAATDALTPAWARRDTNLSASLRSAARASYAAADAGSWNPLFASAEADRLVIAARLIAARRAKQAVLTSRRAGDGLWLVRRLLVEDDPRQARLPDAMRASLAAFGESARRTLRPVMALRRPDGWSILLQSPDAPAVVWFAHLVDPADPREPSIPQAFAVVSLAGEGLRP